MKNLWRDGNYVNGKNEPDKFMILYSTIDRKRGSTKVWMVGNTISRACPYFSAWGIEGLFKKLKQGEIATKVFHNENNDVKIALEYCGSSGGKTMTLGNASNMIDKGGWQTTPQPKLPKSYKDYKCLFRCVFLYQNFKFIAEYIQDKEDSQKSCWFIYPKYTEIKPNTLVFSDIVQISRFWQRDIYNTTIRNKRLNNLFKNTFREGKIFYSDDLTGEEFKQVIDFAIRK